MTAIWALALLGFGALAGVLAVVPSCNAAIVLLALLDVSAYVYLFITYHRRQRP